MKNRIIVIGSMNQDVVLRTTRIPKPGETVLGSEMHFLSGGKGVNQAISAHKLGADVTYVGRAGDDVFGKNLIQHFKELDLKIKIQIVRGMSTGTAIINVDDHGENAITLIQGANAQMTVEDLDIIKSHSEGDILLVQNEINRNINELAIRLANEQGLVTIFNPAPSYKVSRDVLMKCDFVIVNEHELEEVFNASDVDFSSESSLKTLLRDLNNDYDTGIVLTLGADGCRGVTSNEYVAIQGIESKVVDTTGAGDCFGGAFAASLAEGKGFENSMSFANRAAAISVTMLGANASFPYLEDLQ